MPKCFTVLLTSLVVVPLAVGVAETISARLLLLIRPSLTGTRPSYPKCRQPRQPPHREVDDSAGEYV